MKKLEADFFHGRAFQFVREMAAISCVQPHPRATTKLNRALRGDINEQKPARDEPSPGTTPARRRYPSRVWS